MRRPAVGPTGSVPSLLYVANDGANRVITSVTFSKSGMMGKLMQNTEWLLVSAGLLLIVVPAVLAAGHALLFKRDPRAAMGWVGFSLVFPLVGPLIYLLFGVNRIRTQARKKRDFSPLDRSPDRRATEHHEADVEEHLEAEQQQLAHLSNALARHVLVAGNTIEVLHNGEAAYPAMLEAIDGAKSSVVLATYIFETNTSGRRFIDALARAMERGVRVQVLVDGYGELYYRPRISPELERRGIPVARFLPPRLRPQTWHFNLRNHRKILAVDGAVGFVGGMNLGDRHLVEDSGNPDRVVDIHFRLVGPVVHQIAQVFAEDWELSAGEPLEVENAAGPAGEAVCRVITDGPNQDLDRLALLLVGAVAIARRRIVIMTPYFLPSRGLVAALQTAALRGVEVTVLLPGKYNLPFVHWATRNMLWELLEHGIRVFYQPPPFVHSKLFLVDDGYALVGSFNIDPRSLRLNFELAVEIFDGGIVDELAAHCGKVREVSREVSLEDVEKRSLPTRLRDAWMWLFSPYF